MGIGDNEMKKEILNFDVSGQIWECFEREAGQKKVILFGCGAFADCYFRRYGDAVLLDGVIDNDSKKQGMRVDEIIPEAFGLIKGEKKISSISLLDSYKTDEISVLITSKNHYEQIAAQLEQTGIKKYFVLSIMESNQRNLLDKTNAVNLDDPMLKIEYAKECCSKEKIENKKVFFRAYADYADHGKYITEALLKLRKDLDIIWAVDDLTAKVPEGVRKVYGRNWKRLIYEMETSAIWVLDLAVPEYVIKRQGQIYIQTKHWASITLKKFYLDAATFHSEPEKQMLWKRESELIDYIVVGSEFDKESCKRGFQFDGPFIMAGSPRSDGLFYRKENKEKVYTYYGLNRETHVLLYAPTYRFNKEKGKNIHQSREIDFDYEAVKNVLQQRFGGQWQIALRLHPSVASAVHFMRLPDFVIDVSAYEDSEELVSAFDITVSDFSSLMFEPAFINKPVFLYAMDLEDYLENEYELLFDYRELPFDIAENTEELCSNIINFNKDKYEQRLKTFFDKYGVHEDGHASRRTAEFILELLK